MDHLLHIFIPGTPENTAILQMVPALAPLQWQLQLWVAPLRAWKKQKRCPEPLGCCVTHSRAGQADQQEPPS